MEKKLAMEQALRYAEELRGLYAAEQAQRTSAEQALADLQKSYATTVRALAAALELRDNVTGGHAERVTRLALRLANQVAPELAADPELEYGFLLHDLGKIGVPDAVLLKDEPLDEREWKLMRLHPLHGERILAQVPYLGGRAREVVVAHHERWDGEGYPYGLAGHDIPLSARIFALADSFDAMTNDRPYRKALSFETAIDEIRRVTGLQFDPAVARAFLDLASDLRTAA